MGATVRPVAGCVPPRGGDLWTTGPAVDEHPIMPRPCYARGVTVTQRVSVMTLLVAE
jgi:hypothetical protein